MVLPDLATVYLIYYDFCKEDDDDHVRSKHPEDLKYWTALRVSFRTCVQTLNVTFENSWRANVVNSTTEMDWYIRYWPKNPPLYCSPSKQLSDAQVKQAYTNYTTKDEMVDKFCVNSYFCYSVSRALSAAYLFAAGSWGWDLESWTAGDVLVSRSDSVWADALVYEIRNDSRGGCNKQALENVANRAERIAASLSLEMHSSNYEGVDRAYGTAWRTGMLHDHGHIGAFQVTAH